MLQTVHKNNRTTQACCLYRVWNPDSSLTAIFVDSAMRASKENVECSNALGEAVELNSDERAGYAVIRVACEWQR